MDLVAADLKTEIEALPENLQHVLGSKTLHRQRAAPGLVSSLIYRGRELIGLGQ